MEINIKYGNRTVLCQIPDRIRTTILSPPETAPLPSLKEALLFSLRSPIEAPPLSELLSRAKNVTLVVPDKTRECVLDRILPILLEFVEKNGISPQNITILFANGTHDLQTDGEIGRILGGDIARRYRVEQHDAKDASRLEYITTTSRGTEVFINRLVTHSDLTVTVGGIMHHYFAGFGGGPKMLVPGVAGYETIKRNHSYTVDRSGSFDKACRDGNIDSNPVYFDIAEAVKPVKNVFAVNVVLDRDGNPAGFFSGDIIASHRKGALLVSELYEVYPEERADLVIVSSGGHPHDSTFIQAHKAIHHAYHAVKPNGSIVVAAACGDGIGSDTFLQWFGIPFASLGEKLLNSYSLNGHTALSLRQKLNNAGISLLSELDGKTVSGMGMIHLPSLQEGVENILNSLNSPLVHVLPLGGSTVPVLHD